MNPRIGISLLVKLVTSFFILFFIYSCEIENNNRYYLEIGSKILKEKLKKKEQFLNLYSSSCITYCYSFIIDSTEFNICGSFDSDSNLVVDMVSTYDRDFITSDSIKIGDSLEEVLKKTKNKLKMDLNWSYFVKLNSGWYASFVPEHQFNAQTPIYDTTCISFFFKRDREIFANDSIIIKSMSN